MGPAVLNPEAPPSRPEATGARTSELRAAAKTPGAKPMVPIRGLDREVLVGGCLLTCEEPRPAWSGFLRAALTGSAAGVRPYLDTTALVYNGTSLGSGWVQLFREHKLGERRAEIDKWLKDWLRWVDRIVDPSDRRKAGEGAVVVEENQQRFVVEYHHPDLASDHDRSEGAVWRFVLRPRGLEWLVAEIDDRRAGK